MVYLANKNLVGNPFMQQAVDELGRPMSPYSKAIATTPSEPTASPVQASAAPTQGLDWLDNLMRGGGIEQRPGPEASVIPQTAAPEQGLDWLDNLMQSAKPQREPWDVEKSWNPFGGWMEAPGKIAEGMREDAAELREKSWGDTFKEGFIKALPDPLGTAEVGAKVIGGSLVFLAGIPYRILAWPTEQVKDWATGGTRTPKEIIEDVEQNLAHLSSFLVPEEDMTAMASRVMPKVQEAIETFISPTYWGKFKLLQMGVSPYIAEGFQIGSELALFKAAHVGGKHAYRQAQKVAEIPKRYKERRAAEAAIDEALNSVLDETGVRRPTKEDLKTPESRQKYMDEVMTELNKGEPAWTVEQMNAYRQAANQAKMDLETHIAAELQQPRHTVSGEKATKVTNREAREAMERARDLVDGIDPTKPLTALENINAIRADLGLPPLSTPRRPSLPRNTQAAVDNMNRIRAEQGLPPIPGTKAPPKPVTAEAKPPQPPKQPEPVGDVQTPRIAAEKAETAKFPEPKDPKRPLPEENHYPRGEKLIDDLNRDMSGYNIRYEGIADNRAAIPDSPNAILYQFTNRDGLWKDGKVQEATFATKELTPEAIRAAWESRLDVFEKGGSESVRSRAAKKPAEASNVHNLRGEPQAVQGIKRDLESSKTPEVADSVGKIIEMHGEKVQQVTFDGRIYYRDAWGDLYFENGKRVNTYEGKPRADITDAEYKANTPSLGKDRLSVVKESPETPSVQKSNIAKPEPPPSPPPVSEAVVTKKLTPEERRAKRAEQARDRRRGKPTEIDLERLPEWVEATLEEIYNERPLTEKGKPTRMYEVAQALLETGEIPTAGLMKTFRKWYDIEAKEKQRIAAEDARYLESHRAKQEAHLERLEKVDPERGRPPGTTPMEDPFTKQPIEGRYESIDAPPKPPVYKSEAQVLADFTYSGVVKNSKGKVLTDKLIAEVYAREAGYTGKLMKDPDSGGWRVRMSAKDLKNHEKALMEEWNRKLVEAGEKPLQPEPGRVRLSESQLGTTFYDMGGALGEGLTKIYNAAMRIKSSRSGSGLSGTTLGGGLYIDPKTLKSTGKLVKSWYKDQTELLNRGLDLMLRGRVDVDLNYSSGKMWKGVDSKLHPQTKLDLHPKTPDTIQADVSKKIPLPDASVNSIVGDPPFLVQTTKTGVMKERFSAFRSLDDLLAYHDGVFKEVSRVLQPGGRYMVKLQDISARTGERAKTVEKAGYDKARTYDVPITDYAKRFATKYNMKYLGKMIYANTGSQLPHAYGQQRVPRKAHSEFLIFEKFPGTLKEPAVLKKYGIGTTLGGGFYMDLRDLGGGIINLFRRSKTGKEKVTITPEQAKNLRRLFESGKFTPEDLMRAMRAKGIPEEVVGKVLTDAARKVAESGAMHRRGDVDYKGESKFLRKGDDPNELLPPTKVGTNRYRPALTRGEAHMMTVAKDIAPRLVNEAWSWEVAWKTFERIADVNGIAISEAFYWRMKDLTADSMREFKQKQREAAKYRKGLNKKAQEKIGLYALWEQAQGEGVARRMGYMEKPKLTNAEMRAYEWMMKEMKDFYKRTNEARKAAGEVMFPAVENYFSWFNDMNWLRKEHGIGMGDRLQTIEAAMREYLNKPLKEYTHAKHRSTKELPRKLELNAFTVYERYAKTTLDHIHTAVDMVKMNELLSPKFGLQKNAPNLHTFLSEWRAYQKGVPHPYSMMNSFTKRAATAINQNVAMAILSYNVRSALIQPSALLGAAAHLNHWLGVGLVQAMDPKMWRMAYERSSTLSTRTPDVQIYEAMQSFTGVKKGVHQVGTLPLASLDKFSATATWLGAYAKAKSKGMKDPHRYADQIVDKTSASAHRTDRAPIQRHTMGMLGTTLQTWVLNNWSWLSRDVMGWRNPNIKNTQRFNRVMKYVAGTALVNWLYEDILGVDSPFGTPIKAFNEELEKHDDRDAKALRKATQAAMKELAEYIPMIGGAIKFGSEFYGVLASQIREIINDLDKGRIPWKAPARAAGIPGVNQFSKSYNAWKNDGDYLDLILGRRVEATSARRPTRPSAGHSRPGRPQR